MELLRRAKVTGMANITGGGLRNLLRIKPRLGFEIDAPMPVPRIFDYLQEWGRVSAHEMYQTFNMGLGFAVLVRASDESEALASLRKSFPARVIGTATRGGGINVPSLRGVRYSEY